MGCKATFDGLMKTLGKDAKFKKQIKDLVKNWRENFPEYKSFEDFLVGGGFPRQASRLLSRAASTMAWFETSRGEITALGDAFAKDLLANVPAKARQLKPESFRPPGKERPPASVDDLPLNFDPALDNPRGYGEGLREQFARPTEAQQVKVQTAARDWLTKWRDALDEDYTTKLQPALVDAAKKIGVKEVQVAGEMTPEEVAIQATRLIADNPLPPEVDYVVLGRGRQVKEGIYKLEDTGQNVQEFINDNVPAGESVWTTLATQNPDFTQLQKGRIVSSKGPKGNKLIDPIRQEKPKKLTELGDPEMSTGQYRSLWDPAQRRQHIEGVLPKIDTAEGLEAAYRKYRPIDLGSQSVRALDAFRKRAEEIGGKDIVEQIEELARKDEPGIPEEVLLNTTEKDLSRLSPEAEEAVLKQYLGDQKKAVEGGDNAIRDTLTPPHEGADIPGRWKRFSSYTRALYNGAVQSLSFFASPEITLGDRTKIGGVKQHLQRQRDIAAGKVKPSVYEELKTAHTNMDKRAVDVAARFDRLTRVLARQNIQEMDRAVFGVLNGDVRTRDGQLIADQFRALPDEQLARQLGYGDVNIREEVRAVRDLLDTLIKEMEPVVYERFQQRIFELQTELAMLKNRPLPRHPQTGEVLPQGMRVRAIRAISSRVRPKVIQSTQAQIDVMQRRLAKLRDETLRRENYITWLHMAEAENVFRTGGAHAPGMSAEIWMPFLEDRVLDTPKQRSARAALATYLPYALRTIHLEPAIRSVLTRANSGELTAVQTIYLRSLVGRLKGEPTAATRALIDMGNRFGPTIEGGLAERSNLLDTAAVNIARWAGLKTQKRNPVTAFARVYGQRVYSGYLDLINTTALNLTQQTLAFAELAGASDGMNVPWLDAPTRVIKAPFVTLPRIVAGNARTLAEGSRAIYNKLRGRKYVTTLDEVDILTETARAFENEFTRGLEGGEQAGNIQKFYDVVDRMALSGMKASEFQNRGATFFAAKNTALAHGATNAEAIAYGQFVARRTQFEFGPLGRSPLLQNPAARMFTPLFTFPMKSFEYFMADIGSQAFKRGGGPNGTAARAKLVSYLGMMGALHATTAQMGVPVIDIMFFGMLPGGLPFTFGLLQAVMGAGQGDRRSIDELKRAMFRLAVPGARFLTTPRAVLDDQTVLGAGAEVAGAAAAAPFALGGGGAPAPMPTPNLSGGRPPNPQSLPSSNDSVSGGLPESFLPHQIRRTLRDQNER